MKNPTWKIITIGFLRKNDYWGEEEARRGQACTTTLIETETRKILVDPGCGSDTLAVALDRRAGYKPDEIDTVFLTHFHRNHWEGIDLFRKSVWLMAREEIRWWSMQGMLADEEKNLLARMVPIEDHPILGLETLATPGHTHGLTSLIFETREGIVLVGGDAVLTFDHFDTCEPSANPENKTEARRSIERIAKIADVVVPGHDNYFVV